jgi:hypothetical protein
MANPWLVTASALTAIAALLHLGCIVFGASWYRFLGAGEGMARLAEAGSPMPALITLGIAAVLGVWSLYALSGAGLAPRLPLLRTALCAITAVFLLRGVAGFVLAAVAPGERGVDFWLWSSAICLGLGGLYLVGTWRAWPRLGA